MLKKFCPKCGKETEKFYNNLCSECFLESKSSISKLPKYFVIRKCKICEKYQMDDKLFNSEEEALEEEIRKFFKDKSIASISFRIHKNKTSITIKSNFDDLEKEEVADISLVFKKIVCKYCSMKNSGYYQAILQLRLPKELLGKIIDEIVKQISLENQFNPQSFISKVEKKNEGVDIYLGSKESANNVANLLKNKFGVKTKLSRKLAGKVKGINVYRDTILIKI